MISSHRNETLKHSAIAFILCAVLLVLHGCSKTGNPVDSGGELTTRRITDTDLIGNWAIINDYWDVFITVENDQSIMDVFSPADGVVTITGAFFTELTYLAKLDSKIVYMADTLRAWGNPLGREYTLYFEEKADSCTVTILAQTDSLNARFENRIPEYPFNDATRACTVDSMPLVCTRFNSYHPGSVPFGIGDTVWVYGELVSRLIPASAGSSVCFAGKSSEWLWRTLSFTDSSDYTDDGALDAPVHKAGTWELSGDTLIMVESTGDIDTTSVGINNDSLILHSTGLYSSNYRAYEEELGMDHGSIRAIIYKRHQVFLKMDEE